MKLVISALAILSAISCVPAALANDTGKFNAGFRARQVSTGDGFMRVAIWYPTTAKEQAHSVGPFTLRVAPGAALAEGRFGLIVLSHGASGGALNHRGTARALARAGYVVVAVHHPGDNWQDNSSLGTSANWVQRPAHIRWALDAALADKALSPAIDRARIGAVGYSAGGYTVLAAAGARPDLARLIQHCRQKQAQDPEFCKYGAAQRAEDRKKGVKPGVLNIVPEPRLKAVVAIAPVGALFGANALRGLPVKLMIVRAGKDDVLRFPFHAHRIAQHLRAPHTYLVLPNAGHFSIIEPFPEALRGQVGPPAVDPPGTDRVAVLKKLNRAIVQFLARALPDK